MSIDGTEELCLARILRVQYAPLVEISGGGANRIRDADDGAGSHPEVLAMVQSNLIPHPV
jgi:hypothetical protein